jgi:hypothetical protein
MKKNSLMMMAALAFAIVAAAQTVSAQIQGPIDLKVGFKFYAGNTELPAGSYSIRAADDKDPNILELRSADGKMSVLIDVHNTDSDTPSPKTHVVFKKFGDREILSEIFEEGRVGAQVAESQQEKRAAKGGATPEKHSIEVVSKKAAKP